MKHPPLEFTHISKWYGPIQAVDDVSFSLKEGEIFALLGPNGAGKTTCISLISQMETPSSGSIKVFGRDIFSQSQTVKQLIGYVPQELLSHGYFSVREILSYQLYLYGKYSQEAIDYWIKRLSLTPYQDALVSQLSGGIRRRLLIAKALLHKPKLLLLDEPTAGVDTFLRDSLKEIIQELRSDGVTILLTTHYLEEAEELCDRIAILDKGKLKLVTTKELLLKEFTHRVVKLSFPTLPHLAAHPSILSIQEDSITCIIPATYPLGKLFVDLGIDPTKLTDLRIKEGTLHDAFKAVIEENRE